MNSSDTATTISTNVAALWPGDIVFGALAVDRQVMDVYSDTFGTWIHWTDGERDSYPVGYKVHRVEA